MRIIKPSIELVKQDNILDHIVRCAKICYKSETESDSYKFVQMLIRKDHNSMLRHGTVYLRLWHNSNPEDINFYLNNPYSFVREITDDSIYQTFYAVTTNYQVLVDNDRIVDMETYKVNKRNDKEKIDFYYFEPRFTFEVITQISTSRELNRTSPNNIAEQSTRYVNFNKEGDVTLCCPHWFDFKKEETTFEFDDCGNYIINDVVDNALSNFTLNKYNKDILSDYLSECNILCDGYLRAINNGMLPQDARGKLPLDTATKCAYTYTLSEWKNILDLRYYGKTGAPHPNAKIIAGDIRNILNDFLSINGLPTI